MADLKNEAGMFCSRISGTRHPELEGVTDGKTIGTYIEQKFKDVLRSRYKVRIGSSASGIDLPSPGINVDIKSTLFNRPQSSSPFKGVEQKIFGLGHNILLFVYEKKDSSKCNLRITDCVFIDKNRTADYRITSKILKLLDGGSTDKVRLLLAKEPLIDESQLEKIMARISKSPPTLGYLTISSALQWRLQYGRVARLDSAVDGVEKIT